MGYEPISPFRRAMDAACLARRTRAPSSDGPEALPSVRPAVDKWALLRELGAARKRLGVTDRQLGVLQALLSFVRGTDLRGDGATGLVVHAASETIAARLNGMPLSTLRRHVASLVAAGLIARRDSPNGKRYVRRSRDGAREAFGLDLTPLLHRAAEIMAEADIARAEAEATANLRHDIALMRRDLAALVALGRETKPEDPAWDRLASMHPARPTPTALAEVHEALQRAVAETQHLLAKYIPIPSTTDAQNEHHCQKSKKDESDDGGWERIGERQNQRCPAENWQREGAVGKQDPLRSRRQAHPRTTTLGEILTTYPVIHTYATGPIRTAADLATLATRLRPMMGISTSAWDGAEAAIGLPNAVVSLLKVLQRFDTIRSPTAYFQKIIEGADCTGRLTTRPVQP